MNKDGEVIDLVWAGPPRFLIVRGHMPSETAAAILANYYGSNYRFARPKRTWARWSCESGDDGPGQVLREYNGPGRGRFPTIRAEVIAAQVDMLSWATRREGTSRVKCDCDHYLHDRCVCGGICKCHWMKP